MILGIISDTHDNLTHLHEALELFRGKEAEFVIHAGDWVSPFCVAMLKKENIPFFGVYGNNDGDRVQLARVSDGAIHRPGSTLGLEGWKIAVLHEPDNIEALSSSGYFNLIVHGHDHRAAISRNGKTLIVNPGECGGWLTGSATAITLDTGTGLAELHELGKP